MTLIFEIFGKPIPHKSVRFNGKNAVAYSPNKKAKDLIQWQLKPYAPTEPLACPVHVDMTFYVPIPKGTSAIRRRQMLNGVILPITRPDTSNYQYLVENCLTGIVYKDDSQITDGSQRKRYGEIPKTVIKVTPIINAEQTKGDIETPIVKRARKPRKAQLVQLVQP